MTQGELADFLTLALKLRDEGAVKVRLGELEVVWSTPTKQPPATVAAVEKLAEAQRAHKERHEAEARLPHEERLLREFKRELEGGAS